MKTTKATIIIGVCPGYGHSNQTDICMEDLYMEVAEKVYVETGIYISGVLTPVRTVYSSNWGCPKGGEVTYGIASTANPEFVSDIESWKKTVIAVISELKRELEQSTVTVEFSEVDLTYIK